MQQTEGREPGVHVSTVVRWACLTPSNAGFLWGGSAVISAPHIFLLLLSDSPFVSSVAPSAAESVCSQAGHDFIETQ